MGIKVVTTEKSFNLQAAEDETLLELFRRNNIPIQSCLVLDKNNKMVSLSSKVKDNEDIICHSLRNPDFNCIKPEYGFIPVSDPITELIRPSQSPESLILKQFNRQEALEYIFESFCAVVKTYISSIPKKHPIIQVALSSGGDGRVVAECLNLYQKRFGDCEFKCVIMSIAFEDEEEHISNGIKIAEKFNLNYETYSSDEVSKKLNYAENINIISENYKIDFPQDEPEVLGTYWVQELNIILANENDIDSIIFGFNQEDVIADRIYQMMTCKLLPSFPIRKLGDITLLAPLSQIPKKMIDSMDVNNSIRNYSIRLPSVSYLRSSLYFIAYHICEQYPAIADILSGSKLDGEHQDQIFDWLNNKK